MQGRQFITRRVKQLSTNPDHGKLMMSICLSACLQAFNYYKENKTSCPF